MDSATAYASYCRHRTHKIEIKIFSKKINEQLVATINVSCQIMGLVATCTDRLK